MSRRARASCVAAAAVLAFVAGCSTARPAPLPVTCYRAPGTGLADVRRAVVLPFEREAAAADFLEDLEAIFAGEMQKERRFELVPLGDSDAGLASALVRREGEYEIGALIEIARRYSADAALVGTVTQFRAYEPMALGLKAELVSVASGEVVWSAEAFFDCAEEATLEAIREYHGSRGGRDERTDVSGWRQYTASPRSFARFACASVAATLPCGVAIAPERP